MLDRYRTIPPPSEASGVTWCPSMENSAGGSGDVGGKVYGLYY